MSAEIKSGIVIRADAVYDLPALKRMGWGTAALRTARGKGLQVRRSGRKSWVFGKDLLAYLESTATVVSAGG